MPKAAIKYHVLIPEPENLWQARGEDESRGYVLGVVAIRSVTATWPGILLCGSGIRELYNSVARR